MKVGIIAIAKNEDLYIGEWVEHHLSLGFDEIILADNDDTFLLPGIIGNPVVKHKDYTHTEKTQPDIYTELYFENRTRFDWLLFIDIDEFVMLDGYNDIKEFLESFDCDIVRLSCKHFSDNDELDAYGDYRVVERFKQPYYTNLDTFVKSFINCKLEPKKKIFGHGIYDDKLDARNALGDKCENNNQHTNRIVYERAWVNHYRTKTIGEYIRQKYNRGGINNNPLRYSNWEQYFFKTNRRTPEKIAYAQKIIEKLDKENDK